MNSLFLVTWQGKTQCITQNGSLSNGCHCSHLCTLRVVKKTLSLWQPWQPKVVNDDNFLTFWPPCVLCVLVLHEEQWIYLSWPKAATTWNSVSHWRAARLSDDFYEEKNVGKKHYVFLNVISKVLCQFSYFLYILVYTKIRLKYHFPYEFVWRITMENS